MESCEINQQPPARAIAMIAAASFVGILGGLGTILFRKIVAFIHNLFLWDNSAFFIYNVNLHTSASIWGIGHYPCPYPRRVGGHLVNRMLPTRKD